MSRRFNVAGPCKPDIHYMLPAAARVPLARRLVTDQNYFVIHAPRQSGKTTAMTNLAQELTASSEYVAVLLSVEVGSPFSDQPGKALRAIKVARAQLAQHRDERFVAQRVDLINEEHQGPRRSFGPTL